MKKLSLFLSHSICSSFKFEIYITRFFFFRFQRTERCLSRGSKVRFLFLFCYALFDTCIVLCFLMLHIFMMVSLLMVFMAAQTSYLLYWIHIIVSSCLYITDICLLKDVLVSLNIGQELDLVINNWEVMFSFTSLII